MNVGPDSVAGNEIVDDSISGSDIDSTQVQRRVTSNCPSGYAMRNISASGGVTCSPMPTDYWALGGNAGTTDGTHFLGTTDATAFEIQVNGGRVCATIRGLKENDTVENVASMLTFQTRDATAGMTERMRIASNGKTYNSDGTWTVFSDRRLKKNIEGIDAALEALLLDDRSVVSGDR